ncbi:proline-specific peptidase [Xylariomycetidae sp. FL0641]|nr:proline-specific peptidase [Xylariomycetidae sp. FL0641]
MSERPVTEGEVAFEAPQAGKPCKTWYRVVGRTESRVPPLLTVHGGPGACHEYLRPLVDLWDLYGIPVVFYDQIGSGRSTHLREKAGDADFWSFELFCREIDNLVDHLALRNGFSLFGHGWGGMLAATYACRSPRGLRKLVISSAAASVPLHEESRKRLRSQLPGDVQETLEEGECNGDYVSPKYENAVRVFHRRHHCRLERWPREVTSAHESMRDDPTVFLTLIGPSEFILVGSLDRWEGWRAAKNIRTETLLLNGRYDEVTETAMEPWFKTIPRVRWVTLENASHTGFYEDRDRYVRVCGNFLSSSDPE